jgi:hypothetical protein
MKPLLILLLVCVSGASYAQSSPRFSITRSIVAGGGATNSSARFQLTGTVAQPLAAVPSSARFSIQGGFWIRPAPIFFAPTKQGTNFLVSIQSEPGKTYTVQYLNALGSGWQNLSNILGDGSIITVSNAAAGSSQKFYRLIEQ